MKEISGDLFEQEADAICITTNGFVKKNGDAVMGRGVAAQAKRRWPKLPAALGMALAQSGNHLHWLDDVLPTSKSGLTMLLSFPVKHNWWEKADLTLIERSAGELVAFADLKLLDLVALPRPGCANGKLDWKDVRPILRKVLDDRFIIVQN